MRIYHFAKRNLKELIRDPLSIIFTLLLPLFLLFIFQQFNIPSDVYKLENFTPGIIIFSFSFLTLFTASLVAKDRCTSFLTRLYASPMKSYEYILGYICSILPLVLLQNILFFIVAILLGLPFSISIIYTILILLPISILFICLGILIGCLTTEKGASGFGSVIVQLVAFTSGMYFDASMVGKVFQTICNILPFSSILEIAKNVLNQTNTNLLVPIIVSSIYIIGIGCIAIITFHKKMTSEK